MNEEEKFDELINSKLSEREFPFDELNWDEAERLIIQQERLSKLRRTFLIFSGGLILGIAVMLPFVLSNHNAATNPIASKSNLISTPLAQNNVAAPANQATENIANKNSSKNIKASVPVQSAFVKKNNRTGIQANSSKIATIKKKVKSQPTVWAAKDDNVAYDQPVSDNIIASAPETNKIAANTETVNPKESNSVNAQTANSNSAPVNNNTVQEGSASQNGVVPKTNENIPTNATPKNTAPTNSNIANSGVNNNKSNNNNTTSAAKTIAKTPKAKPPKKEVAAKSDSKGNNTAASPIKRDSIMAVERSIIPGTEQPYQPVYVPNILSVYAGANYSFGWDNNGAKEGNGITPLGGFIYTHYFSYRYSASIGVGYSELNKLNKTYTGSVVEYNSGQYSDITMVTPQRIYYLTIPIKIQCNFTDRSIASIGVDALYVVTTRSNITTYHESPAGETMGGSSMQSGYTQGFSNFDFQLTGAYTRMLTDRLSIRPEYYFGINYIETKSFPGINQLERNQGLRIVILYHLMKR